MVNGVQALGAIKVKPSSTQLSAPDQLPRCPPEVEHGIDQGEVAVTISGCSW